MLKITITINNDDYTPISYSGLLDVERFITKEVRSWGYPPDKFDVKLESFDGGD